MKTTEKITHIELDLRNLGPLVCIRAEWVSNLQRLYFGGELLDELIIDALLHEYTCSSAACLSVIEAERRLEEGEGMNVKDGLDSVRCPVHSGIYVGIVEDDIRALPTKFQCDFFEVGLCSRFHNLPTHDRAACECNLLDPGMLRDCCTNCRPESIHNVEDTWREPRFHRQFGHLEGCQGRELARFQHDRIACRECRANLPGEHKKREVPGDNLPDDSDGFMAGIAKLRFIRLDDFSMVLVRPSGVVANNLDSLRDVSSFRNSESLS